MIYKLQRKFVLISTVSVLMVVASVFVVIVMLNIFSMNRNMDILADRVSEGGGRFVLPFGEDFKIDGKIPKDIQNFDFITPETPFSTRHFTVFFDENGAVKDTHTESIYSITKEQAIEYAEKVKLGDNERGWISNYRYKIFSSELGEGVVFVDGSMSRLSVMQSTTSAGVVLVVCAALVLVLIFLLSKRAVKPIAESYEKQKQFITNVNHELKTPLTLILANLDIAESEMGENEWLDDIRTEGHRMTELVNQLVALSRMDEEGQSINISEIRLGEIVSETAAEFGPLAKDKVRCMETDIDRSVMCFGDEVLLRRLIGILMDNAVKYCDMNGDIAVKLHKGRHTVLTVENTYEAVAELELNRLFDRFYRADEARKFTGGYGIGLSMAKAIVEKHKGEITAYEKGNDHIGFKVTL